MTNPLLETWTAPHGLPPLDRIEPAHFEPAFDDAMREHRAQLEAIAHDTAEPDFDNTAAALDRAGRRLDLLDKVFHTYTASNTSPALQAVERDIAPRLAAHDNAIYLNAALFARLDAVHAQRTQLAPEPERQRLVERLHTDFVRAGARLQGYDRAEYARITEALAGLTTQFGQNVLGAENDGYVALNGAQDVAGLPAFLRDAASQAGAERGLDGPVVTLSRSMVVPFLEFSERRDLREKLWRAWTSRAAHAGAHDNRAIVTSILRLRARQARLLGFATYADYSLADKMAREPSAVARLLDDVWQRALPAFEGERQQLVAAQQAAGVHEALEAWDWRYWAQKVRAQRFAIDDAEVKPYFSLERMIEAAFDCAHRLFGISFSPRRDFPVHHPDVRAYEVLDARSGAPVGVFLRDDFSRPSKRSGAWMHSLRDQSRSAGPQLPIVTNDNNFSKAPPGEPTLLSFDDVRTLFHEFGHALHGLLSDVTYRRLSGTAVLWDFVELPSQLFEHWMSEPEVLRRHARHVVTDAPIPDALIERLRAARRFGSGYETVRYVASALTDMAVHAVPLEAVPDDVMAFEAEVLRQRQWPAVAGLNHRFTHFQHLFSGSAYAAGYYVYLWAEVLDCDVYTAFVQAGDPFAPAWAAKLRRHIYAVGDSVEPGATFVAFRGRGPRLEPMLEERGLLQTA